MLRCVSKIKSRSARIDGRPVRLQFVCVAFNEWCLGWAARQFGAICNVILGLDGAPKRHGHKFRRACVRRGLANCQTYVLKRSLDARPAHIIYLITLFQTLSYPRSPLYHLHSTLLLATFDGSARIAKTGKAIDDQTEPEHRLVIIAINRSSHQTSLPLSLIDLVARLGVVWH